MKTYNQFLTTPFSEEKNWIQKATKNMRKDKPCTGEKFGSETCPPGSKRYNLAKTFKKMAKEEATPEPPKEDPSITAKEKRQMQIKKQVLLKKMQAVRAGAGADIVAGYEPEGEVLDELKSSTLSNYIRKASSDAVKTAASGGMASAHDGVDSKRATKKRDKSWKRAIGISRAGSKLANRAIRGGQEDSTKKMGWEEEVEHINERLGGKGYSRSTMKQSLHPPSRKSSGDWEDSDRGAGNKSARRAGKKVEKKSPTYLAHVHNKKVKEDKAFDYVVKQLQKKHGKDAVVTKDNPMKPPTAAQKKAYAAHKAKLAKQDHRDETEKATSGRYNDRSRSD